MSIVCKAPGARCSECTLLSAPFVPSSGPNDAKVVVIGEAPGNTEVEQGKPFVGPSGKILDYAFRQAGMSPIGVFKTNTVSCHPPENRKPTAHEIDCCSGKLTAELDAHPDATIVATGDYSLRALGVSYDSITTSRGRWLKWHDRNVMPTWHPAYILRQADQLGVLLADIRKAVNGPIEMVKQPSVRVPTDLETLANFLQLLEADATGKWCAFDLETDQLRWYDTKTELKDSILCLALCTHKDWAVLIPDHFLYDDGPAPLNLIQDFFLRMRMCGHNAKFDALHLRNVGVYASVAFDTMLAHYILDENSKHGLKVLALNWLGVEDYESEMIGTYLKNRNDYYSKIPPEVLYRYAARDVAVTLTLRSIFEERLAKNDQLQWPFYNIIMPMNETAISMERRGIRVDEPYLIQAGLKLEEIALAAANEMKAITKMPDLNIGYPQALSGVMYGKLGYKKPSGKGISNAATGKAALAQLPTTPFTSALRRYRSATKLNSSYVKNLLGNADETDRVHCTILIHGTEVGRLSMRDPALQTIPREKGNPYGAMIRGAFVASTGFKLVIGDYSQAELRALAGLSMDPFLLKVYNEDRDLHTEVAIAMFGPNFTKEQRVMCKMFNFAYAYGGTEHSFAQDAGLPLAKAVEFVKRYDENMPAAKAWKRTQFETIRKQGYVTSIFGRRRRFPLITHENENDARKSCVHMLVAGTAADLTLLTCTTMEARGWLVVLTVHDSIIMEVPTELAGKAAGELKDWMESAGNTYLPQVKWKADVEIVDRWAEPPTIELAHAEGLDAFDE